jgi:hypothetical protein
MDENAIVNAVCERLVRDGCEIVSRCTTTQRGIDVVARATNGQHFYVEAKGGTSTREGSARFGKTYSPSQIFDRVAKGVFTCLQLRSKHPNVSDERVVLALPDDQRFRVYVESVDSQLRAVAIEVWFVSSSLKPAGARV